jgi:Gpi18-like mannosyltransferase
MKLRQAYILCLFVFVLLCLFLPRSGRFDTSFWVNWSVGLKTMGLAHAYTIDTLNYNPLYLYLLRAYAFLMPNANAINQNINYLKIVTLLFDFGAVMLLMHWVNKNGRSFLPALFILFNIAYLYNTLYWGQVDAIHTTLIFIAFVLAFKEKLAWSVVLFLLAFNIKTQSILFLPVLGLVWLPLLKGNGKEIIRGLFALLAVQVAILLPFILKGTIGAVWHNLVGVVDYNPFASMRAYNFWYLVLWKNTDFPKYTSDVNTWFGLTYKAWGFILFFIASAVA